MKTTLLAIIIWSLSATAYAQTVEPERHKLITHALIAEYLVAGSVASNVTAAAVAGGKFHEVNPLMQPFAGNPTRLAIAKASSNIALGWLILAHHERQPKAMRWLAAGLAVVTTIDAVHDVRTVTRR